MTKTEEPEKIEKIPEKDYLINLKTFYVIIAGMFVGFCAVSIFYLNIKLEHNNLTNELSILNQWKEEITTWQKESNTLINTTIRNTENLSRELSENPINQMNCKEMKEHRRDIDKMLQFLKCK